MKVNLLSDDTEREMPFISYIAWEKAPLRATQDHRGEIPFQRKPCKILNGNWAESGR